MRFLQKSLNNKCILILGYLSFFVENVSYFCLHLSSSSFHPLNISILTIDYLMLYGENLPMLRETYKMLQFQVEYVTQQGNI